MHMFVKQRNTTLILLLATASLARAQTAPTPVVVRIDPRPAPADHRQLRGLRCLGGAVRGPVARRQARGHRRFAVQHRGRAGRPA
ncbi:MAG: hypothetical protein WKG07_21935 [Hymenobacter sp.]